MAGNKSYILFTSPPYSASWMAVIWHIYLYAYIYLSMSIDIYVCIYLFMSIYLYVCLSIHLCLYLHSYTMTEIGIQIVCLWVCVYEPIFGIMLNTKFTKKAPRFLCQKIQEASTPYKFLLNVTIILNHESFTFVPLSCISPDLPSRASELWSLRWVGSALSSGERMQAMCVILNFLMVTLKKVRSKQVQSALVIYFI